MYFIVNISRPPKEIVIGDLNFGLGPNKAIDLEKIFKRRKIEESEDLKRAVATRVIQIRHISEDPRKESLVQVAPPAIGLTDKDMDKIKEAIKKEIREKGTVTHSQSLPPEITNLIKLLQETLNKKDGESHIVAEEKIPDISEEKLADIHAKTVEKKTKNYEGSIRYEEKSVKEDLQKKSDELGDMLK